MITIVPEEPLRDNSVGRIKWNGNEFLSLGLCASVAYDMCTWHSVANVHILTHVCRYMVNNVHMLASLLA